MNAVVWHFAHCAACGWTLPFSWCGFYVVSRLAFVFTISVGGVPVDTSVFKVVDQRKRLTAAFFC